jgi:hypothetical protein
MPAEEIRSEARVLEWTAWSSSAGNSWRISFSADNVGGYKKENYAVLESGDCAAADSVPFEPTASGIARRHRTCLVHRQRAALESRAVHLRDGLFTTILHIHERESFGAACFPIVDDPHRFNRACLAEQIRQFSLGGVKRQISNVQSFLHQISFFLNDICQL